MLTFYYGVMNSGKSLQLMKTRYNYVSSRKNIVTIIPDYKNGDRTISSRAMKDEIEADTLIGEKDSIIDKINEINQVDELDAIFVDEVQFLTISQIRELRKIATLYHCEIYCYGLLTTTDNDMFGASKELLLMAHKAKQLHSLCQVCGNEYASHHIKHEGAQHDKSSYESVCYECWKKNKEKE